ncbi:glycosyltransferase [Azotosporobacter soli]|uniref:glycosyltransferase n=1 Tax=Azotosporobacter soli TaxID=3055040 RepID=UPI0031FF22BF
MKFAIVETVVTPGGHEIDYDRILVEELKALGHEVEFYVPEGHRFQWDYRVPIHEMPGSGVSYDGIRGIRKWWRACIRERRRHGWYETLFAKAKEGAFDALIFPSATYRYLRGLRRSKLLKSPVPTFFIIHGLTPTEAGRLFEQGEAVRSEKNVKILVQTFARQALSTNLPNVHFCNPPAYVPRDIPGRGLQQCPETLTLGFFGQYRKEKNLDTFLDVFGACRFERKVKLLIQGATKSDEDAADFQRIIEKYGADARIEFLHKALIGPEWQAGIDSVDALVMPYPAERYRYHTSAMLSNGIGFYRPMIIADNVNPEVLAEYGVGIAFDGKDLQAFQTALETFVNTFDSRFEQYRSELQRANDDFSPRKLAQTLVDLAK